MSFCSLKSFLALLLGAGVLGWLPAAALAGDKIEFSRASESLALPTVDRPESEPADAFSLVTKYSSPQPPMFYPIITTPAPAPVRRNDDRNARNGNSGLSSDLGSFGQNSDFENPFWESDNPNYSSKPSSNYSNSTKAPGSLENLDRLDPALDRLNSRLDPRYGQPNARLDSLLNPSARRDRLNDPALDSAGRKNWTSRSQDAYGSARETSVSDFLRSQGPNAPREPKTGLFKPASPFAASPSPYASLSSSLAPPISSIAAPLDATESHESLYKESSGHLQPLGPVGSNERAGDGLPRGIPGLSVWGDAPGFNLHTPPPAPPRKPPANQSQMGPQRQQGGAVLPWPKKPGSVFNNNNN
jgi:hypothetical protein